MKLHLNPCVLNHFQLHCHAVRPHQALRFLIAVTNEEGLVEVRMEALVKDAHVEVHDVTFLQV